MGCWVSVLKTVWFDKGCRWPVIGSPALRCLVGVLLCCPRNRHPHRCFQKLLRRTTRATISTGTFSGGGGCRFRCYPVQLPAHSRGERLREAGPDVPGLPVETAPVSSVGGDGGSWPGCCVGEGADVPPHFFLFERRVRYFDFGSRGLFFFALAMSTCFVDSCARILLVAALHAML